MTFKISTLYLYKINDLFVYKISFKDTNNRFFLFLFLFLIKNFYFCISKIQYIMNNKLQKFILTLFLFLGNLSFTFADPPNPPDPGGDPGGTGGVPVGAPIDDGIMVLLILAVLYGCYRVYEIRKARNRIEI